MGSGWADDNFTKEPQPEFCAYCGHLVGRDRLQMATAEGLRPHMVCDTTPDCRNYRHTLSYNDLRSLGQRAPSPILGRQEPTQTGEDAFPLETDWG